MRSGSLQAHSLAVLATPDSVRTFRLATAITDRVEVSDRFHLKPLLRAIAFPQHAFVLALSENAVRLVEVFADLPPSVVRVHDLPKSAADAVGRASVNNLTQGTRIANAEGQTVLLRQYARQVDAALRAILGGRETPLILQRPSRSARSFGRLVLYPLSRAKEYQPAPTASATANWRTRARPVLDRLYADEVDAARALFQTRLGQRRATTNIGETAHAATKGAVELLLVDIDHVIPGTGGRGRRRGLAGVDDERSELRRGRRNRGSRDRHGREIPGRAPKRCSRRSTAGCDLALSDVRRSGSPCHSHFGPDGQLRSPRTRRANGDSDLSPDFPPVKKESSGVDGPLPNAPSPESRFSGLFRHRRAGGADAMEQRSRRFVADRAMWSYLVVVSTPTLKLFAGVGQRQEPMRVQAFRAQSAVERLDEGVVGRLARP